MDTEGVIKLCGAVIKQAIDDYYLTISHYLSTPAKERDEMELIVAEKFFRDEQRFDFFGLGLVDRIVTFDKARGNAMDKLKARADTGKLQEADLNEIVRFYEKHPTKEAHYD